MGETEEKLISKWGPPNKSYTLSNGSTIVSYEYKWGELRSLHTCSKKFTIQRGTITKWGISGCDVRRTSDFVPKSTPIPQPTM